MPNVDTESAELTQKDSEAESDELSEQDLELVSESEDTDDDQSNGSTQEDSTDWKAEAQRAKAVARRLANKLRKQQEKQEQISKVQPKEKAAQKDTPNEVDEKILRATKGYDDEAVEELKFIAEREKISLFAAQADKRFIRYLAEQEEERKRDSAGLGASKGAGRQKTEPTFATPSLTAEQHRALWAKANR